MAVKNDFTASARYQDILNIIVYAFNLTVKCLILMCIINQKGTKSGKTYDTGIHCYSISMSGFDY